MYIKKITISGFRSYRETNTISGLSARHNVIIGGNGCGKSNVLNAIQFVLSDEFNGLNANQRQQLINESHSQRLLLAFVEIVVDNSDRRIPLDVNDIAFRRQIGLKKDQYFMNNKIVTHSDIVNMLETAGFSRSNPYYIIKQGKVNEMATASDEYRLQVMREVAGTRIYDTRKCEAVKLLAEAAQRVDQMDDCLNSLDERLTSLQTESKDLEKWLKWDKRRRLLEYIIANKESEVSKNEILKLERRQENENQVLEEKRKRLEDFQQKCKVCDKKLKLICGILDDHRKDLKQITKQMNELDEQKARIESKINDFKESLDYNKESELKAKQELLEVRTEIDNKKKRLVDVTAKYDKLRKKENDLISKLKAKQSRKLEIYSKQKRKENFRTVEDRDKWIQSELTALKGQIETNTQRVEALKAEESETTAKIDKLSKQQKSFVTKEENLFKSLQNERQELCESSKLGKQLESKRREFWELDNELKAKEFKLNEDKQKIESKLKKMSGSSATVGRESVAKVLKSFEERADKSAAAEKQFRPIIDGYLGQVIDCFSFDPNLSKVVEVTTKSKLFYHIIDNDKIGTKILAEVNERQLPGEFCFIAINKLQLKPIKYPQFQNDARPLTSLLRFDQKYEKVMKFLFDRTLVCRTLELATTFSRSAKLDCVTIDGDFISHKGYMTGGYYGVDTRVENFLKWKSILSRIDGIRQEMAQCLGRREDNEKQLILNSNLMTELDIKHNNTKREFDNLKNSKDKIHQQLVALNTKQESIARSIASLESTLPSMIANKESFESELEFKTLDSQLTSDEERELSAILRKIESLSAEHSDLCGRRLIYAAEKSSLESELDKILVQRKNELEMTLIDARIMESETLVENESFDLELIDKRITSFRQLLEEKDAKIDELVKQQTDQKELLDKLRAAEDKQMDIINVEAKTSRKIAIKLETIEKKHNECLRKLSKMGTIPSDCDTNYHNMSLKDEYLELQKCKQKLSRMPSVNQKALDQLTEGREKGRILQLEKREIKAGYESIQRLIETLEHQKYEKIQVTYKSVSKFFVEIFQRLVPEGKAFIDMVYKDSADGSSAGSQASQESQSSGGISGEGLTPTFAQIDNFVGVRIRVAFTGKTVVKEMNQLSGGQKSIVALAFIFAIQRCDPPPFYLFDEVDQALDPFYRKALADLIKEMSKTSQFISTTFRPELLGSAQKFFGVKFAKRISHIEEISVEMANDFVESDDKSEESSRLQKQRGDTRTRRERSVHFDTTTVGADGDQ